ncbi:glycosyltransferase [Owenweeksia hongkongensis]|uniref:glycosyltransferase n=1 Tax=Owenweeksia hongkongensis TaxID=253245 RepID=UPI003A958D75
MNVLFTSRSTLFTQPGGDTLQVEQTAKYLRELGHTVDIKLCGERININDYQLVHFFNIIRPADLRLNIPKQIPLVVSSIYHDYSEYDKLYRGTASKLLYKLFGKFGLEYIKVNLRWLNGSDTFSGLKFLLSGNRKSIKALLKQSQYMFTTSHQEAELIEREIGFVPPYKKVNLGSEHISVSPSSSREGVLCAARIEGFKNQLNLIKALKDTNIPLTITGAAAANHSAYYESCQQEAGENVSFLGRVSKEELEKQFGKAKVHALISFYETTGLSTLEALKAGCNVVITDRGAQKEIFENHAHYCEPNDIASIKEAVETALVDESNHQKWVEENFSWKKAAEEISDIYQSLMKDSTT